MEEKKAGGGTISSQWAEIGWTPPQSQGTTKLYGKYCNLIRIETKIGGKGNKRMKRRSAPECDKNQTTLMQFVKKSN